MIQICNQHRDEKKAMAFAFILYDFRNPEVKELLDNNNYWLRLDEISGQYLTIFSLNYNGKEIRQKRQIQRWHSSIDKVGFMISVPVDFNPSIGTN